MAAYQAPPPVSLSTGGPVSLMEVYNYITQADLDGTPAGDISLNKLLLAMGAAIRNSNVSQLVPAPTGVAATDMANIQAAINTVHAAGGGTVQLQPGVYNVTSVLHSMTSVTYSTGTWTVNTGTVPTVGQYIMGPGISGPAPKVLTVGASTFTTDVAPSQTVSAAHIYSVTPGIVLDEGGATTGGVTFQGVSPPWGFFNSVAGGTIIVDNGSGVTIMMPGGTNQGEYFGRMKIRQMAIWGDASIGSQGNTLAGIFVSNNMSFLDLEDIDISGHLAMGLAIDWNQNTIWCRNVSFTNDGNTNAYYPVINSSPVATNQMTGAICKNVFNAYSGGGLTFRNCWGNNIQGAFYFTNGSTTDDAVLFESCIWNNINTTNASGGLGPTGTGIICNGQVTIINLFSESATLDVWANYASATIVGGTLNGGGTNSVVANNDSFVSLTGVQFNYHTGASVLVENGGIVTWSGCSTSDSGGFISGVATAAQAAGVGSTLQSITPGTITKAVAVTVASNAGTVPVTNQVSNFTNSSAATMAITMATTGAVDGQVSVVRVYDFSAASETIGWTNTENGGASVPTTSNGSTTLPKTVQFMFNAATSKWRCTASD